MKARYLSVRCEDDMREAVDLAAKRDERTAAEWARLIIRRWLIENGYLPGVDSREKK